MTITNETLAAYSHDSFEVWVQTPTKGFWQYRKNLILSVAERWAAEWNKKTPEDVPRGSTFVVLHSVTTYALKGN